MPLQRRESINVHWGWARWEIIQSSGVSRFLHGLSALYSLQDSLLAWHSESFAEASSLCPVHEATEAMTEVGYAEDMDNECPSWTLQQNQDDLYKHPADQEWTCSFSLQIPGSSNVSNQVSEFRGTFCSFDGLSHVKVPIHGDRSLQGLKVYELETFILCRLSCTLRHRRGCNAVMVKLIDAEDLREILNDREPETNIDITSIAFRGNQQVLSNGLVLNQQVNWMVFQSGKCCVAMFVVIEMAKNWSGVQIITSAIG